MIVGIGLQDVLCGILLCLLPEAHDVDMVNYPKRQNTLRLRLCLHHIVGRQGLVIWLVLFATVQKKIVLFGLIFLLLDSGQGTMMILNFVVYSPDAKQ